MRRSRYYGAALLGLLVVAAISVAGGSGRKPAKELGATASLRRLSGSEVMDIINKFPDMVPSYFAEQRNDTVFLKSLFPFSEVTSASLEGAFPGVRFYKGLDGKKPPHPYLMAVAGSKRYMMPGGFNHLLMDGDRKVTDKNIIDLAKAFVLLAVGSEPIWAAKDRPAGVDTLAPVTFLEAKRITQEISGISYEAKVTVKIGERVEVWHFGTWYGQFAIASRGTEAGQLIKQYDIPTKSPEQRGQFILIPSIEIEDSSPSNAYVEWQDTIPHYYLIVDSNSVADSFKEKRGTLPLFL